MDLLKQKFTDNDIETTTKRCIQPYKHCYSRTADVTGS